MIQIGLIDADLIDNGTRHPNLALMKISAYCKSEGNSKLLFGSDLENIENYNLIIISKVFNYTKLPNSVARLLPSDGSQLLEYNASIVESIKKAKQSNHQIIAIGGTGFFEWGGRNLDEVIEHIMPDYSLYDEYIQFKIDQGYKDSFDDYKNYSIGFTTRGCFRKCEFCVNKKYDRSFENSPVSEFLNPERPRIYLWDDNFLSYGPGWEKILNQLNMTGKPFQFRQGLDIRLVTIKKAKILSQSMYYGDFIFAFDHIDEKDAIIKRLMIWRKFCKKTTKLYVLCGYLPTHPPTIRPDIDYELQDIIDTLERISILMSFGCLPYIMRYEDYKLSRFKNLYIQLARWCNQPQFFKKKSFREYCEANQYYTKTEKECSSHKAMREFEEQYPEVASKYFDIKFEMHNKYDLSYSYGRIKSEPCEICQKFNVTWDRVDDEKSDWWIKFYLERSLDITCLQRQNSRCRSKHGTERLSSILVNTILSKSINDLSSIVDQFPITAIDVALVPQFSNFDDATSELIHKLGTKTMTFEELGACLRDDVGSSESFQKYGENHAKLATLLDLVTIKEEGTKTVVSISPVGLYLSNMPYDLLRKFTIRQILRIPIIQQLLIHSKKEPVGLEDLVALSGAKATTVKRRSSSVRQLISLLFEESDSDFAIRLNRIRIE